mgnify:FL=1
MMKNVCLYWRLLLTRISAALAVSLTVKNILFFIPCAKCLIERYGVWIFVLILVGSLVYAFSILWCKPNNLSLDLNKATKLTVSFGDLFDKDGITVIPVNEYFDTHLGDCIVAPNTIHGLFLKKYKGQISRIASMIRKELEKKEPLSGRCRERNMVKDLPEISYPLGTCIRLIIDNKKYLLVAVTRFNENEHVDINLPEYPIVIQKLFYEMEQLSDANPVYLPLIGGGQAGVKLTKMQLLNTIIRAGQNSEVSIYGGVHVILYGDELKKEINLNIIEHLYKCWKGL